MIEPLIRRSDEAEVRRSKEHSSIKTTPESIVRLYRLQKSRREPAETPYIFTPKRPRIPWHRKINWEFAIDVICIGILGVCALYITIWLIVPFLRMLWAV